MSKNLIKFASQDAYLDGKNGLLNNSACAIADAEGVIVGYKDENGEIFLFQNGVAKEVEKHYYAVFSDGSKLLLDGRTELLVYSSTNDFKDSVSISIPPSVTSIAFGHEVGSSAMTNITSLFIPKTVQEINSFKNCTSLSSITFEEGFVGSGNVPSLGSCPIKSIIIPNGYNSINFQFGSAPSDCTHIEFGTSVTSIAYMSINDVTFRGTIAQWKNITQGPVTISVVHCTDGDCDSDGNVINA